MRAATAAWLLAGAIAGCATPPPAPPPESAPPAAAAPAPSPAPPAPPLVESPPLEPVAAPARATPPTSAPAPPEPAAAPPAATTEPAQAPAAASEPTDEQQLASLLADLQRYGTMGPEDLKREVNAATQTLARQRNDYNRVRLAVLHTLVRTSPQDDTRAMQLLESVAKGNPGSPALKQLAAVLLAQVAERQRAVRDEQQKADAAVKKLEALRSMERDLLRDRIRGGGGGGAGGSSGGGGGGGGGG